MGVNFFFGGGVWGDRGEWCPKEHQNTLLANQMTGFLMKRNTGLN